MTRGGTAIGPGGDRRTITVTFGYPDRLRTLVAQNLRLALVMAEARWGHWETIESISTPDTIYSDLTGATKAHQETNRGPKPGLGTVASKLRGIGYQPAPDEIGTLRYFREELPSHDRRKRQGRRRGFIPPQDYDPSGRTG